MGLFDSIRRVVGGQSSDDDGSPDEQPDLVDTRSLDIPALQGRAEDAAGNVEQLDFSLDSLEQFDSAIDAGYDEELATSDDPETYDRDVVKFGCYLGEVLVRVYDGEWTQDPGWGVQLTGPDDTVTVSVFDVATRSIRTGAVFAAVTERAAEEVGLDGPVAQSTDDEDAATETDATGDTDMAASEGDSPAGDPGTPDEPAPADETTDTPEQSAAVDDDADETPDDQPISEMAESEYGFEFDRPTGDDTDADTAGSNDAESGTAASDAEAQRDSTADSDSADSVFDNPFEAAGNSAAESTDETVSESTTESETAEPTDGTSSEDTDAEGAPTASDGAADTGGGLFDGPDDAHESTGSETTTGSKSTVTTQPDPTDGDGIRAEYAAEADGFVSFWNEHDLDYSPASLERLDDLVDTEWEDDRFDDATFGSEETFDDRAFTSVATELGSYFGEVLVRELDAEWTDETATDSVIVEAPDGQLAIPVFRVAGTSLQQQPVFGRSYDSLLSDIEDG